MKNSKLALLYAVLLGTAHGEAPMALPENGVMERRERALELALAKGDLSAIDDLLARSFEVRMAKHPGKPIPKDQWLHDLEVGLFPGRVSEWSVFSDGVSVWVSYRWIPKKGKAAVWVMDRWDGVDENAHLLVRFYAPAESVRFGK